MTSAGDITRGEFVTRPGSPAAAGADAAPEGAMVLGAPPGSDANGIRILDEIRVMWGFMIVGKGLTSETNPVSNERG